MTEKDKELIAKANTIRYQDWYLVGDLITQAESDEAKEELRFIRSSLYHREEYAAGML